MLTTISANEPCSVSNGIRQPPSVHSQAFDITRKRRKGKLQAAEYFEGIRAGDRVLLSRAITILESTLASDKLLSEEILDLCIPHAGRSTRLGITGVPGVGKSSFIEEFGTHIIDHGHQLAVLAIDPSSQRSGGSIMGDKTRMESLSVHDKAFIRPSPSAGSLGGVARKTRETISLCEAAGFDTIIVETVGVGQSETAVYSMVDFFLLLMLPGSGDELQGIKRGIMEMADAIAITKADGDNIKKAEQARIDFSNALHFFPPTDSGWVPQVRTCSAVKKEGLEEIWGRIQECLSQTRSNGWFDKNRQSQLFGGRGGIRLRADHFKWRCGDTMALHQPLRTRLVHGQGRSQDAGPGHRYFHHLQRSLDRPVLTARSVHQVEYAIHLAREDGVEQAGRAVIHFMTDTEAGQRP